jgi:16S rRNA (guanine966-N2)-methyltransferase
MKDGMKITGGAARGRIIGHARKHVRPTSSKVREAVFNILGSHIEKALFLDLYAGTGIMGCEALSRGAAEVFFVEKSKNNAERIKEIVKTIGFEEHAHFYIQSAFHFIEEAQKINQKFDIIFMDPPYYSQEIEKIITLFKRGSILAKEGLMILEHFHKNHPPERIALSALIKQRRYGDTVLSMYKKIPFQETDDL